MQYPQWFVEKPIKEYQSLLDLHTHYILPERDHKGRRVFLVKTGNIDLSRMKPTDMAILDEIVYEAVAYEPETLKNGTLTITDMSGYSYRNLSWLMPDNLNIAARKSNCNAVLEHHEHHIINSSMLVNTAFSLMSPFMNKTIKDHVFFHYDDYEVLHKHVNPEILPEEYRGTGPALDYDAVYERFIYNQEDIFQQLLQEGYVAEEKKQNV
ncbi:clavesin-1 [Anabrus simplex]|uniref:clavesin-1 n=1 Tax=Anabrus simplex TaxID=316456 RepID=UPI0035A332C7